MSGAVVRRDPLTGLANRIGFEEELHRAFSALQCHGASVSLLMLDLDGFKAVNDRLGHPAGDVVLRGVARRMQNLSRRSDYLARLGGDEFAIVVADRHEHDKLFDFARRLISGISEPFDVFGQRIAIGVSIGVSTATSIGPKA